MHPRLPLETDVRSALYAAYAQLLSSWGGQARAGSSWKWFSMLSTAIPFLQGREGYFLKLSKEMGLKGAR